MDVVQDWATYLLGDHANPALTLLAPYTRQLSSLITNARAFLQLLLNEVINKPDLTTIALLLIILFVSLKLLNLLWQTVLFWVRIVRRVVFWGGIAMLGVWLYTRGVEGVVEDLEYWAGVWKQDYEYWVEREKVARTVRGAMGNQRNDGWSWF